MDDLLTPPPIREEHEAMSAKLSGIVAEGKETMPEVIAPLVCKPLELEPWRVFKIMSEFVTGFELIQKYSTAASFFGSERAQPDNPAYQAATELAARLARYGFAIITGGAQGIMEAANKGAHDAGGASLGLNIRLQSNQPTNTYTTESMFFDHFFVRKVMLTFSSSVYIYFPGGFGTLDEFFEILTLVQTGKIKRIPIVLYGKEFWTPLLTLFKDELATKYRTISPEEMDLFHVVDSVDEAYEYITKNVAY